MSDPSTTFQRLILLAAAVALPGCSVFYELDLDQCSVDADCASIGQGLICGTDNICKLDDRGCGSHAECLDRPENIGESACIKESGRDRGECVTLKSQECPQLLPLYPQNAAEQALRNADPIILGAFTAVTLSPFLFNFDMAVSEVNEQNAGLPTQGGTRPVLMVACNGNRDDDTSGNFDQSLDTAMDHLIDLKVPGVVSGMEAAPLKRIVESKGLPSNTFFMSSQESDSSLDFQDNGLLWQVLPGGRSLARSYRPIVERTLAFLQGSGALSGTARIAQVNASDIRLLAEIASTVQSTSSGIIFNGLSVADNGDNYLSIIAPSTEVDLSPRVQELLDFKPHVIISTGSLEFLTKVIPQVELAWSSRVPGQARPFYILSPYHYQRQSLRDLVANASYPGLQERLIGVNAPAAENSALYDDYIINFQGRYEVDQPLGYENFYDAAYYLLYATAAARPTLTDGVSVAQGMYRLLRGPSHNVGKLDMNAAFRDLQGQSSTIALTGTMGPPAFDEDTGGRDDAGAVWCLGTNGVTMTDVLKYNDVAGTMDGSFPCFTNF